VNVPFFPHGPSGPFAMAWHGQIFAQGEVNVFRKVSLPEININQRASGPAIVAVFTRVGEALFHDRHSLFLRFFLLEK
jgi:hypothetical protein